MTKEFKRVDDKYYRCVLYKNFGKNPYLVLEDGTEVFRKDVEDIYTFFDYYDDKMDGKFFQEQDRPYMIATGAGTIVQLEDMMLTSNERRLILEKGLRIFLYEIVWYHKGSPKKFIVKDNQQYSSKDFCFEFDGDKDFFCFDLDCIRVFMRKNNIENVEVVLRDYGIADYVQDQFPKITFKYRENYIASLTGSSDVKSSFDLAKDMFLNLQSQTIIHKFWCGNWRYAEHRYMIASFLARLDCKLSWAYQTRLEESSYWPMLEEWRVVYPETYMKIKFGSEILNENGPMILDIPVIKTTVDRTKLFTAPLVNEEYICPTVLPLPFKDYTDCFCAVVTESEFRRPSANISEKVINAIKACRPFVLVSSPRSLEWMHKLGFKTFSCLWDESYDTIQDHEQRLLAIFELIEYIDSKDIQELKSMYDKVHDILEHNFNRLSELRDIDTCDL